MLVAVVVDGGIKDGQQHHQQQEEESIVVQRITNIKAADIFAPFTLSGQLMVNGVLVSSFVTLEPSSTLQIRMGQTFTYQWIAHSFQFYHRLVCYYLISLLMKARCCGSKTVWHRAHLS